MTYPSERQSASRSQAQLYEKLTRGISEALTNYSTAESIPFIMAYQDYTKTGHFRSLSKHFGHRRTIHCACEVLADLAYEREIRLIIEREILGF